MSLQDRVERAWRLIRGSGTRSQAERARVAAGMLARLGPRQFLQVLRDAALGPPLPQRGGPHPPADGPPPVIPEAGPLISVLLAGPDVRTPASLAAQSYRRWELCAEEISAGGPRAPALQRALERAQGEWVLELRAGDALGEQLLAWIAHAAAQDPGRQIIYTDEDVRSGSERTAPQFKPDWSPTTLLSANYTGRAVAYRRDLLLKAGGIDAEHEGALGYDLILRASEQAEGAHHVPRILYHAASSPHPPGSPGRRALEAALTRRGETAQVSVTAAGYRVRREVSGSPRVALLIPTRDRRDLLQRCLESHWERTTYSPCEVVVMDDGSGPATRGWLEGLQGEGRITLLRRDAPFNFSALMNAGARATDAEVLVCLNNDTEVLEPDWLQAMLEHIQRPDVGAVGARLLYPDERVQHAGIVLGVGPDRVACQGHQGEPAGSGGYLGRVYRVHDCSAVSAACLMVRRAVFEELGGFDEVELPISYSDVDLCLRLAQRGLRSVYTPWACLRHAGSASRSRATDPREVAVMRRRWGPLLEADPYYSPHLTRERLDFSWWDGRPAPADRPTRCARSSRRG